MAVWAALILGCAPLVGRTPRPEPMAAAEVAPPPAMVPARARYHYLVGQLALAAGDLDGAEAAFNTGLLHDRHAAAMHLGLAAVARARGADPQIELGRVAQALLLAPDDPEVLVAVGDARARLGQIDAAVAAWSHAADVGAGSPAYAPWAARLLARDVKAAGPVVARWATIPETDAGWLRERGHARLQTGDLAGATDDLGTALLHDPTDARVLEEFNAAVTGSGRYRQGLLTLDLVGRLTPTNAEVLLRTWHLAVRADDPVRARDALISLDRALGGNDAQVKLWLADVHSQQGDVTAALAALAEAARIDPPAPDVPYHRARFLRAADRPREAREALVIPTSGPNRIDAQALQVRLLIETGRAEEAYAVAEAALAARPADYTLLGALVAACAAREDREGMLAAVDQMAGLSVEARARTRARSLVGIGDVESALIALRSTPLAEAETWVLGGALLGDARRSAEAVRWMEKAVDAFPSDASVRAALGLAQEAAGDAPAALITMREALVLDPANVEAVRYYSREAARSSAPDRLLQARTWLLSALERHPADAGLLAILADVHLARGEPAQAAAALEEARRYAPRDLSLAHQLVAAWKAAGHTAEANALERSLKP